MRPTHHAIAAAAFAGLILSGSATAAPGVVSGEVFVKLPAGASDSGEQLEIESFSWGGTAASGAAFKGEVVGIEPAYGSSGGSKARGGTATVDKNEKITIHGAHTESKLPGKRTPPTVTLKRGQSSAAAGRGMDIASVDGETVSPGTAASRRAAGGDTDRPIIIGSLPNPPAGPMQYNPKEYSVSKSNNWAAARRATPLAKGSVWIRVSSPWGACRVGAHYPTLELGGGGKTYVLQDVTVASCGRSGDADDRPTEEVAFYYNKIAFNAANKMSRPAE